MTKSYSLLKILVHVLCILSAAPLEFFLKKAGAGVIIEKMLTAVDCFWLMHTFILSCLFTLSNFRTFTLSFFHFSHLGVLIEQMLTAPDCHLIDYDCVG